MSCNVNFFYGFVLPRITQLESDIRVKAETQINDMLSQFANDACPSPQLIALLINQRNNIVQNLNLAQNNLIKYETFLEQLNAWLVAAKVVLSAFALNPLPAPTLLVSVIIKAKELVDDLTKISCALEIILERIISLIEILIDKLNSLDFQIARCNGENDNAIPVNIIQRATPQQSLGAGYRGFNIKVITQESELAPLRTAVAENQQGVIVLRGQPSYASSTQVLIDEMRFRIDAYLE